MRTPRLFRRPALEGGRTGDWTEPGVTPAVRTLRPAHPGRAIPYRTPILLLSLISGVTALGGGLALIARPRGTPWLPAEAMLHHTPFDSFFGPGLLLTVVIAGTSLAAAFLVWRRSLWAVDATLLASGALCVWIFSEAAMLRTVQPLHVVYGAGAIAWLTLGVRAAWRSEVERHRWVARVALAETIGFLAPVSAGVISSRFGLEGLPQLYLVVLAGFIEGAVLGFGQANAFPFPVLRRRYVVLTCIAAGLVWTCAMAGVFLAEVGRGSLALMTAAALATTAVGLVAIGTFQWFELRKRAGRARRWIPWTALAWAVALPFSFMPAPFVDAETPAVAHFVLWACGGMVMAYVFALVTWQGVRRLHATPIAASTGARATSGLS